MTENQKPDPEDDYASSKLAGENAVAEVCSAAGITLTILRPVPIIGEGGRGNIARLISADRSDTVRCLRKLSRFQLAARKGIYGRRWQYFSRVYVCRDTADRPNRQSEPSPEALTAAIIFLWLFLFDTIFTRFRQVVRIRPFWRPHREHLYQQIVAGGASHRAVSGYFGLTGTAAACAFGFAGTLGAVPLIVVMAISSVGLLVWAREKD